jgi:nitroimidazol reductase NimA-like FMN-containing flavoprotein (pyridoxamine 5'-phosphate oxidase superfamily)
MIFSLNILIFFCIIEGMRRKEKRIEDIAAIKNILKSTRYITLAMCHNNQPYLVTLSHGYDDEKNCLYFHCAGQGKKLDILKANNTVWGQAIIDLGYVPGKCDHLYQSVHFRGEVFFLEDSQEMKQALEVMIRQLEKYPGKVMAEQLGEASIRKVVIGRIDLKEMWGKQSTKATISL